MKKQEIYFGVGVVKETDDGPGESICIMLHDFKKNMTPTEQLERTTSYWGNIAGSEIAEMGIKKPILKKDQDRQVHTITAIYQDSVRVEVTADSTLKKAYELRFSELNDKTITKLLAIAKQYSESYPRMIKAAA